MISIINSNILGSEAVLVAPVNPYLDQQFAQIKKDLYDLIERLFNLITDMQKLQDMQTEYLEGDLDFSAVARADKEVTESQNLLIAKFMQYLIDSNTYLPGYNYLYPDLYNPNNPFSPSLVNPNLITPTTPLTTGM